MRGKKILFGISVLFYLGMILLSLSARRLYTASLVRVRICYPEQRLFRVDGERAYLTAIPEELAKQELYSLKEVERNGELRYVAERLEPRFGELQDGYYPVLEGINILSPLVVEGMEGLTEGQEVCLENEEELKSLY